MAGNVSLTGNSAIERGATYVAVFELLQTDGATPFDLNGYTTFAAEFRSGVEGNIEARATVARTNPPGTDGSLTLSMSATETRKIRASGGAFDIFGTTTAGIVTRLVEGSWSCDFNVTQASSTVSG